MTALHDLPVCCRLFPMFWGVSGWLSMVFTFPVLGAFAGYLHCFWERVTVRERRDSRRGCVPALLPVVSWVLVRKWLIINTIHFSGYGWICWWCFSLNHWFTRLLWFLWCVLICWCFCFILGLQLISGFAGLLPVVSYVLIDKSLIINGIHFSGKQATTFNFL